MLSQSDLNQLLPISLKHLVPVIERVYERYPQASKADISLVIRRFLELLRLLIISQETVSINRLFPNLRLQSFARFTKGKYNRVVKLLVSTPKAMQKSAQNDNSSYNRL